jgi:polyphosphate kinase
VAAPTRLHPEVSELALLNRELSALELNARVLDLAADPNEPLLERVKFCGIVSSVLDEFFMVRVAGLLDQLASGLSVLSPDGRTPQQTLTEIRGRVLDLTASQSRLWRDELCPALEAEGVTIGTVEDAERAELHELETLFARQIYPVLTPLAAGLGSPSRTSQVCRSASASPSGTRRPARSDSRASRCPRACRASWRSAAVG